MFLAIVEFFNQLSIVVWLIIYLILHSFNYILIRRVYCKTNAQNRLLIGVINILIVLTIVIAISIFDKYYLSKMFLSSSMFIISIFTYVKFHQKEIKLNRF